MRTAPLLVLFSCLLVADAAQAQDFGVLESAETITRGNFKVGAFPMFTFPEDAGSHFLMGVTFGHGFTDSLDLEGRAAFADDVTFIGGDVEYWAVRNRPLDLSLRGGFHLGFFDGDAGDSAGLDAAVIASFPVTPRLELVEALDMAFNWRDAGATRDRSTTMHIVPGVEFALTPVIDLLGEFGIGITDSSSNYVAFGAAFYWR